MRVRFSSLFYDYLLLRWPHILSTDETAGQQGRFMLDPDWRCGVYPIFLRLTAQTYTCSRVPRPTLLDLEAQDHTRTAELVLVH